MRLLRIVLPTALTLIAAPLAVAAIVKKRYFVERDITIQRSNVDVFTYLKYLKNQDNFSKWASLDPAMKKEFRGTDGTVGFVSAWESDRKNVGVGEQEIKRIVDGERIDYELRFLKPFKSTSSASLATDSISENETRVRWSFSGHMNYPMNIILLFMDMSTLIGNDLETGLTNLKRILEKAS